MVASTIAQQGGATALAELFRPDLLSDGAEPEQRIVHSGISWERYLTIDRTLGTDRSVPRLYYLEGELEIMTTSNEHERIKELIGDLIVIYFEESGLDVVPRGQATLREKLRQAGAEPDKSWCIGPEKAFPDLVLEVALSSGGIEKLDIYRHFAIPEVWFWRRKKLEIFGLDGSGAYRPLGGSALLPGLDIALIERCVAIASWQQARREFRAGLKPVKAPKRK